MIFKNITFAEAVQELSNQAPQLQLSSRIIEAPRIQPDIPMSIVQSNTQNILKGLPYFEQRGISDPTSYAIPLGVKLNYRSSYQLSDGSWFNVSSARYAVPNIFDNKCRSINYRRDNTAFLEAFFNHEDHSRVMDDLSIHYSGTPESNLLPIVAGAKYKQEPESQWRPFNVNLLVRRENNRNIFIPQPYICVHAEPKEFDTLALMDLGIPAVGVCLTHEVIPILPKLFEHIPLLYIIRDSDEPGMNKAIKLQEVLGRGRIITPPNGCKDTGDMIQQGIALKHLSQYGLEPIR